MVSGKLVEVGCATHKVILFMGHTGVSRKPSNNAHPETLSPIDSVGHFLHRSCHVAVMSWKHESTFTVSVPTHISYQYPGRRV